MSNESVPTFTSIVDQIMRLKDASHVYGEGDKAAALRDAAKLLAYYAVKEERDERKRQVANQELEEAKRKAGL